MDRSETRTGVLAHMLRRAIAAAVPRVTGKLFNAYRPERHYMRGPGPKSLAMIGRRLRRETQGITQEPLPERWRELMRALESEEQRRSGQSAEPYSRQ